MDILSTQPFLGVTQAGRRPLPYATTKTERLLLLVTIALLPLEDHIPTVAGISASFISFALLMSYAFLHRARAMDKVWRHPVFLAAYIFLLWGLLIESAHPDSNYLDLIRLALMIAGGVVFASMCRDKKALRTALYGYVIGSFWLSLLFFTTSYAALSRATADNYHAASAVRTEVSEEMNFGGNLNQLGFLIAEGGVVALALTLTARTVFQRMLFLGAALVCITGAFLPMSRSVVVILVGACATILFNYRAKRVQSLVIGFILLGAIAVWVPDVVFSRMEVDVEGGRKNTYSAVLETLPEYILTGVGAGHFWKRWRYTNSFGGVGAHNIPFQVTIAWGIVALFAVLAIVVQAYKCLPQGFGKDSLGLCLAGLAVAALLMAMFSHGFWDKWYSMILGLLVGARYWIWPTGIATAEEE